MSSFSAASHLIISYLFVLFVFSYLISRNPYTPSLSYNPVYHHYFPSPVIHQLWSIVLPTNHSSTHLHVSLKLQQMKTVPGDKTWALVGEVDPSEAGLACAQVRLTDGVVVGPNKVVVNGDVLKLGGVAIGTEYLLVPKEHQKRGRHASVFFPQHSHKIELVCKLSSVEVTECLFLVAPQLGRYAFYSVA